MKKILLLELCFLFLATTFQGDRLIGWVQQTIPRPDLTVRDLQFVDTLTGYIVQSRINPDTSFISKTTDGGNSWIVTQFNNYYLTSLHFIDKMNGYCAGGVNTSNSPGVVLKTTDGGINWFTVSYVSGFIYLEDIMFANEDTGWVSSTFPLDGGLWRTTNGGISWQKQMDYTPFPSKIFFVNSNTGWVIGSSNGNLYKTTNSGESWFEQTFIPYLSDMFFVSADTGWVIASGIKRSTNGGYNWFAVNSPGIPSESRLFFNNNKIGWSGSGPNKIYATKDGFNWGIQYSPIFGNNNISFVDSVNGWAGASGLVKTTDGGGPITYTGIKQNGNFIPAFELKQNYPNPFNAGTRIRFSVLKPSYIELKIFDISGREITRLISGLQYNTGEYDYYFDPGKHSISSGIYFYTMKGSTTDNKEIFIDTKKLMLLK